MQHGPAAEAQQVQGSAHPPAMAAAAAVAPAVSQRWRHASAAVRSSGSLDAAGGTLT